MRILQIVSHYVPAYHYGGVLHVAHSLSKAFVAQGHDVRVCTTRLKDPSEDLDVPSGEPVDVDGARVYYEPVRLSRYWGLSPAMARRIWGQLEWADVALIHFHYQFASFIGGWASRLRKKPYVVFTHGSLNNYGVSSRSRARKHLYLRLIERSNFKGNLFTAYHSEEEMENSLRFGDGKVVPNGISPTTFSGPPPRGSFREKYPELKGRLVYLYLGRIDAGKGLDLLLPAFGKLAAARDDVHLVLAGGDERGYSSRVKEMISELDLSRRVTMTGLISGPDKLGALRDSDVYVLPSRSEGLSIAMLEAMYMGLPVIVTDRVGLWRTIQEQGCGLVVPLDRERLAEALRRMAADGNRAEMGRKAYELVARDYTWDTIACNLVGHIRRLTA
ncbi:MAG TPA: glycosyltransferase [Blastocatellia bacterium]|nr:glycosyltransferase [Blastocatellia bacterium]